MNAIDWRSTGLAHRILLACGIALLVDMFLTWQGLSVLGNTVGVSGWHGAVGTILGLLTIALVVWEVLLLLGSQTEDIRARLPFAESLVSAALAGAVLVFAVLKFLSANELRRWPEWVGIVLALAIGYGGWLAHSEAAGSAPVTQSTTPTG
jgi:hypothetical protein